MIISKPNYRPKAKHHIGVRASNYETEEGGKGLGESTCGNSNQ